MGKITACLSHGGGAGNAAMRAGLASEPRNEISHPYCNKGAFHQNVSIGRKLHVEAKGLFNDTVSNMCGYAD